jgi:hypothetical protein
VRSAGKETVRRQVEDRETGEEGEQMKMLKRFGGLLAVLCVVSLLGLGMSVPVWASGAAPGWEVFPRFGPTNLPPGGEGRLVLWLYNIGAAPSIGTTTLTDTLPAGVTATEDPGGCSGMTVVTCSVGVVGPEAETSSSEPVEIKIPVRIASSVTTLPQPVNRVTVAGGGALAPAVNTLPVTFSSEPAAVGFSDFDAWTTNADGTTDTQAGSHPYEMTLVFGLNVVTPEAAAPGSARLELPIGGEAHAVTFDLPPGLVGASTAVPRCTHQQLESYEVGCPRDTQVGVTVPDISYGLGQFPIPVYNMVPPPGTPTQLGFDFNGDLTLIDAGVRSGGDNDISTRAAPVPSEGIVSDSTVLWGVPGEHGTGAGSAPFLRLPTSCGAPQAFGIEEQGTWQDPNAPRASKEILTHDTEGVSVGFTGCEALSAVPFEPSLAVAPATSYASTAAGMSVNVKFPPQVEGLTAPNLRNVSVVFPEGLTLNPGQATGLTACQPSQEALGLAPDGEVNEGPVSCPASSRVGTMKIKSPLLEDAVEKEMEGGIYVLQSNPPNIELLYAPSADGVNFKFIGKVHLDEATGRLTATFSGLPDLPFGESQMTFNGGPQASIVTPSSCGAYTATSDFTPWSSPFTGDAFPTTSFNIAGGVDSQPCGAPLSFNPGFTGGTTVNQAGGFSPVSVSVSRQDTEQDLGRVQVTTPPGLSAILKGVERCGEPQASQGTCGPGSLIGHTSVTAGPGPDPLSVQGGQVFLTGPYKDAPFGLSIVVPAVVGPFNLGNVVVRSTVSVDPHTAQITISSDPLPTILDGVPLHVRSVNVTIDRQGFTFNPTSCEPMSVNGVLTSTQGTQAGVASHFQAAGCTGLPFHPGFSVSTQAKTSKAKGASLDVKYTSGVGQANTAKVAVSLPKALPARLTTIQQACTETVFAANPASCPAGSDIGTATAITPILSAALSGPVYLVSHGGAAFPDIVAILQGEGVTIDLTGSINIKGGVTSAAFDTVPDAPIGSFQMVLPEGPHSGLASNLPAKAKGSMCGQSLTMPTTITGQNGAQVKQTTKITVTGCPKAKKKAKRHKQAKKKQGKKKA